MTDQKRKPKEAGRRNLRYKCPMGSMTNTFVVPFIGRF
jgi:hypothetical protein